MNPIRCVALSAACACLAPLAGAQQGQPVTRAEAQALFQQMKGPCDAGSDRKACGVMVYSPEDCTGKEKDPHVRKIYQTYDDGTVRFQEGGAAQVARQRPGALLVGFGIFDSHGKTTRYGNGQFLSREAFDGGQKTMTVCGKTAHIHSDDFDVPDNVRKFLKANP